MASTATSSSDMTPSPRVKLDLDPTDLDGDTDTVTILQSSVWGQVIVRGAERKASTGGVIITDFELPAGVPVTYRVEQFDDGGVSLGYADLPLSGQVEIPVGKVVIQDPLAPARAIMLNAHTSFAANLTRGRQVAIYQAGEKTFGMSGPRGLLRDVSLACWTENDDDRAALDAILQNSLILVRTDPSMRLPGAFYAVVGDTPQDSSGAFLGSTRDLAPFTGNQVTRPALEILAPLVTLQTVHDYLEEKYGPGSTLADFATEWATLLDVIRNPPTAP